MKPALPKKAFIVNEIITHNDFIDMENFNRPFLKFLNFGICLQQLPKLRKNALYLSQSALNNCCPPCYDNSNH